MSQLSHGQVKYLEDVVQGCVGEVCCVALMDGLALLAKQSDLGSAMEAGELANKEWSMQKSEMACQKWSNGGVEVK